MQNLEAGSFLEIKNPPRCLGRALFCVFRAGEGQVKKAHLHGFATALDPVSSADFSATAAGW